MTEFQSSDRFRLRPDLVVEEVDDDVVVLDLAGNKYFGLQGVAWLIWQELDQGEKDLGHIVEEIASEFDVAIDQVRSDVEAFLTQLLSAGLASRLDEAAG